MGEFSLAHLIFLTVYGFILLVCYAVPFGLLYLAVKLIKKAWKG